MADGVNISGHDIVFFSWQVSSAASKLIENPTIADNIISVSSPEVDRKYYPNERAYFKNKVLDDFYIIPHLKQPMGEIG